MACALSDYDELCSRSEAGLRSCKEALAFVRERAQIESTYGEALVNQARLSAGALEHGSARQGWFAFKSKSESTGRKHLELAQHFNADGTALAYLRDRLAVAHKSFVCDCAPAVRDVRATLGALSKARARHAKLVVELDTLVASQLQLMGPPSETGLPPPGSAGADAAAAVATRPAAVQAALKELGGSSAAYNSELRSHKEALRTLSAQLPKLLSTFEKQARRPFPSPRTSSSSPLRALALRVFSAHLLNASSVRRRASGSTLSSCRSRSCSARRRALHHRMALA